VWRPRKLGSVIAERRLRFAGPRKRARVVSLRFGQPVRSSRPERGDPWWCPVEIRGLGKRSLRPIAGEDSLQALVLAFEFVSRVLPVEAERAGGHIEWLGERERLVFANTLSLGLASTALQNLVEGLATAIDVLENGSAGRPRAAKKMVRQLRALIASGGHTSDPGHVPKPSNMRLETDRRTRSLCSMALSARPAR
jgi:Domain of unknown function (DUF6968)